eukprot:12334817-Heterocapsa_arctica.AAC.1
MLHCVRPPLGRQASRFKDIPCSLQHLPYGPFRYRVGSGPIRIAGAVPYFQQSNCFFTNSGALSVNITLIFCLAPWKDSRATAASAVDLSQVGWVSTQMIRSDQVTEDQNFCISFGYIRLAPG